MRQLVCTAMCVVILSQLSCAGTRQLSRDVSVDADFSMRFHFLRLAVSSVGYDRKICTDSCCRVDSGTLDMQLQLLLAQSAGC